MKHLRTKCGCYVGGLFTGVGEQSVWIDRFSRLEVCCVRWTSDGHQTDMKKHFLKKLSMLSDIFTAALEKSISHIKFLVFLLLQCPAHCFHVLRNTKQAVTGSVSKLWTITIQRSI